MKLIRRTMVLVLLAVAGFMIAQHFYAQAVLEKIIVRLRADSRAAEVLVTAVNYNEGQQKNFTTIKFVEYDTKGSPLPPKYFTFPGNLIQFQSLVVRFDDQFVMAGDRLRGQSVYLFWKVFMLDGANTKEFPITHMHEVPSGYAIDTVTNKVEGEFWNRFWDYAFDQKAAARAGIKNAQIEAPGTVFIPGYLYTIKIEHNGGLRIDASPLPAILRGEQIN